MNHNRSDFTPAVKCVNSSGGGVKSKTTSRQYIVDAFYRFDSVSLERYVRVYSRSVSARNTVPPSGETPSNASNASNHPAVWRFIFDTCRDPLSNAVQTAVNWGRSM